MIDHNENWIEASANNLEHIQAECQGLETKYTELEYFIKESLKQLIEASSLTSRSLLLILQLRHDLQNILLILLGLENSIHYILSVTDKTSEPVLIERLKYFIGFDDYTLIMKHLKLSLDRLKLQQERKDKASLLRKVSKRQYAIKDGISVDAKLYAKLAQLKQFTDALKCSLEKRLVLHEAIEGSPSNEIVLEHMMTLKGPVSKFHQAVMHGLSLVTDLSEKISLQDRLDKIFSFNTELKISAIPENNEELEARAYYKRTRPFFN